MRLFVYIFILFCPSIVLHPSCAKENMHPRVAENKCDFFFYYFIYVVGNVCYMCCALCSSRTDLGKTNKVAIVEEIVCVHFYIYAHRKCLHSFCRRVFIFEVVFFSLSLFLERTNNSFVPEMGYGNMWRRACVRVRARVCVCSA